MYLRHPPVAPLLCVLCPSARADVPPSSCCPLSAPRTALTPFTTLRLASVYRSALSEPLPGIDTTYDVVCYAAETYPDKRAFGTRSVEKVITETKQITKMVDGKETTVDKEWKYFQLGPYEWISTYREPHLVLA